MAWTDEAWDLWKLKTSQELDDSIHYLETPAGLGEIHVQSIEDDIQSGNFTGGEGRRDKVEYPKARSVTHVGQAAQC